MATEDDDEQQGLSTPQKIAAGTALGVAIPAAVGVAKKLIGNDSDEGAGGRPTGV